MLTYVSSTLQHRQSITRSETYNAAQIDIKKQTHVIN